ncbi:MAG: hypothetical protein ACRBBN_02155 [Methyloligellaceae bacterium]
MNLNDSISPAIISSVKNELDDTEEILYIEQPVGHRFRLSLLWDYNAALVYLSLLFFIVNWKSIQTDIGYKVIASMFLGGTMFVVSIAVIIWLNARRTVYVVTSKRAMIMHLHNDHTHVMSFTPEQINIRIINEDLTGAGDLFFCKEARSDVNGKSVQELYGFNSVPDIKKLETALNLLAPQPAWDSDTM